MSKYYCGNNALNNDLQNGIRQLGDRYTCLKIGIGKGLSLPYDKDYNGPYEPIDPTRIYCGNKDGLPNGYDRFGNISQCLQKGIAIGKKQKAINHKPQNLKNYFLMLFLFFVIDGIIFLILFYTKPSFITIKDKDNIVQYDPTKFTIIFSLISCLIFFIIFFIFKKNTI